MSDETQAQSGQEQAGASSASAAAAGEAQSQAPASGSGEADYAELERKVAEEGYSPSVEESIGHEKWVSDGRKPSAKAQEAAKTGEPPAPEPAAGGAPKGEDPSDSLAGLMRRFKVNSINELPGAIKAFEDERNAAGGQLGRERKSLELKVEELERRLQHVPQQDAPMGMDRGQWSRFLEDFRNGVPGALLTAEQMFGYKAGAKPSALPDLPEQPPEDIVDEAAWKHMRGYLSGMKSTYEKRMEEMAQQLEELRSTTGTVVEQAQKAREAADVARRESLFLEHVGTLAERHPDQYRPPSGDFQKMVREWFHTGFVDPRIQPLADLYDFATKEGITRLDYAHYVRSGPDFQRLLASEKAEAEKRAREAVLKQGRSPGLSAARAAGGEASYQHLTSERVQAIVDGREPPPDSWWDEGGERLDPSKVPVEFHSAVFPGMTDKR